MTEDRDTELEGMVARLEASGRYRVLRRLPNRRSIEPPNGDLTRQALFVDVETTGLNPDDEIIEIALLRFTYGSDGRIVEIGEAFQRLREPSKYTARDHRTHRDQSGDGGGPEDRPGRDRGLH